MAKGKKNEFAEPPPPVTPEPPPAVPSHPPPAPSARSEERAPQERSPPPPLLSTTRPHFDAAILNAYALRASLTVYGSEDEVGGVAPSWTDASVGRAPRGFQPASPVFFVEPERKTHTTNMDTKRYNTAVSSSSLLRTETST